MPIFSKIFEDTNKTRMDAFISKHKIINTAQYGFQKRKSTEDSFLKVQDKIIDRIEQNLFRLGLFLDLEKSFDTIQHDIFLVNLEHYGIRGIPLFLLKSYLEKRESIC